MSLREVTLPVRILCLQVMYNQLGALAQTQGAGENLATNKTLPSKHSSH